MLARSRINWLVDPARARAMVPPLRADGLRSCALYADATTNDARLCLENVRAAAEAGACVLNGAEVLALRTSHGKVSGAEIRVDGEDIEVDARVVVNAAGPWVDQVRRLEDPGLGSSVRLSKGAHVLVSPRWGLERRADDHAGPRARHLRGAVVRHAPPRHDGRRARGRAR